MEIPGISSTYVLVWNALGTKNGSINSREHSKNLRQLGFFQVQILPFRPKRPSPKSCGTVPLNWRISHVQSCRYTGLIMCWRICCRHIIYYSLFQKDSCKLPWLVGMNGTKSDALSWLVDVNRTLCVHALVPYTAVPTV